MLDFQPAADTFLADVLSGLRETPRRLPCKYFYDRRGSQLFEQICELDEYYLTRTELAIMRQFAPRMTDCIGARAALIEFGSGSSVKTRLLLKHMSELAAYVPVDISRDHLRQSADDLSREFVGLDVLPVCADFTESFRLPNFDREPEGRVVYFPGSTIGNFGPDAARAMLGRIAALCGRGGGLLIGIDLQKDTRTIEAAYDDARGVTAEFNLNLLHRINRDLGGDFDVSQFAHRAVYNAEQGRVEMYLVSQVAQSVTIGNNTFDFAQDEAICTEHSHKYTIEGFQQLAAHAGWSLTKHWTDDDQRFAVLYFSTADGFAAIVTRSVSEE